MKIGDGAAGPKPAADQELKLCPPGSLMTGDTPNATYHGLSIPACPRCRTKMRVTRITPERPGFEARMFECPRCGFEDSALVKYR